MEDPSYGAEGDQTVRPSASEDKKKRKRTNDKRYRDKKKQETENIKRELKMEKAEKAEWKKNYAELQKEHVELQKKYADQLEKHNAALEKARGQPKNCMDQQPTRINMSQPFSQLPIERTLDNTFATREAVLPVHHTPCCPSGIPMRSGGSTTIESTGIDQSRVSQEWAPENSSELLFLIHENSSNLLPPTYEDQPLNVDDYQIEY